MQIPSALRVDQQPSLGPVLMGVHYDPSTQPFAGLPYHEQMTAGVPEPVSLPPAVEAIFREALEGVELPPLPSWPRLTSDEPSPIPPTAEAPRPAPHVVVQADVRQTVLLHLIHAELVGLRRDLESRTWRAWWQRVTARLRRFFKE
jgi:hypothetical protein